VSTGYLYTFGSNSYGELGFGYSSDTILNYPYSLLSSFVWDYIYAGYDTSFAIESSGKIYSWGRGTGYVLGFGDEVHRYSPQYFSNDSWYTVASNKYITDNPFTLGIKTDGSLWYWGLIPELVVPSPEYLDSGPSYTKVAVGAGFGLAIKSGSIYGLGINFNGQLGVGDNQDKIILNQAGTDTDWDNISCGGNHSLAIKTDGSIYSTGRNYEGQLGIGNNFDVSTFTKIGTDTFWTQVVAGENVSLFLKNDGTIWGCGYESEGVFGGLGSSPNSRILSFSDL
jgi:alpha-tubulin suppressor-like RCC1 family protein